MPGGQWATDETSSSTRAVQEVSAKSDLGPEGPRLLIGSSPLPGDFPREQGGPGNGVRLKLARDYVRIVAYCTTDGRTNPRSQPACPVWLPVQHADHQGRHGHRMASGRHHTNPLISWQPCRPVLHRDNFAYQYPVCWVRSHAYS